MRNPSRIALAVLALTLGCIDAPASRAQPPAASKGAAQAMPFAPHPGTIKMVDLSTGTTREVPYQSAPERSRFVYLDKTGAETSNPEQAVERIPIVLVERMPLDAHGNLARGKDVARVRILEFGPDRRPLRSTTLVANPN
jgi:hypothetical protein